MTYIIIITIIYLSIHNHNVPINNSYYKKHFNTNNSMSNKIGNAQESTSQLLDMHHIVITNQSLNIQHSILIHSKEYKELISEVRFLILL